MRPFIRYNNPINIVPEINIRNITKPQTLRSFLQFVGLFKFHPWTSMNTSEDYASASGLPTVFYMLPCIIHVATSQQCIAVDRSHLGGDTSERAYGKRFSCCSILCSRPVDENSRSHVSGRRERRRRLTISAVASTSPHPDHGKPEHSRPASATAFLYHFRGTRMRGLCEINTTVRDTFQPPSPG